MPLRLQFFLILGTFVLGAILVFLLKRKSLDLKYSLLWIFACVCMIVASCFPKVIEHVSIYLGIATSSNMVFAGWGVFVLLILLSITVIVSKVTRRIYSLTQHQAILEKQIRELEQQSRHD